MKLIGIAGKARTGKDCCAKYLWQRHAFTRIAFADSVKMAAAHVFGLTAAQTWDDSLKEQVIEYWGMSPREMFQRFGTEAVRAEFGEDTWIKRWLLTYNLVKDTDCVVVPDVRSEPEAEFLRALGGTILHLTRGAAPPVRNHSSEAGIAFRDGDVTYANDGTLDDLAIFLDTLVS